MVIDATSTIRAPDLEQRYLDRWTRPHRAGPVQTVTEALIVAIGLRPIRVGNNDKANIIDDFVTFWFTLAFQAGFGRNLGFKSSPANHF